MNKFIDRNTQYPNRKILDVKSVTRNDIGEIKTIYVEEIRNEGEIYEEGTPLNANTINHIIQEVTNEEVRKKFEENNGLIDRKIREEKESIVNNIVPQIIREERENLVNNIVPQIIRKERENIVSNIVPQIIREEREKMLQMFFSNNQIIELDKSKIEIPSTAYFNFELQEKGVLGTIFEWTAKSGTGITIKDRMAIVKRSKTNQNVTLKLKATNKEETEYEEFNILVPSIQYIDNYKESTKTFSILADGSSSSIFTTTIEVEENVCPVIENEYENIFEVQASINKDNILTITVFGKANPGECGISEFCFKVRVDNKTTGLTHHVINGIVEFIESIYPED